MSKGPIISSRVLLKEERLGGVFEPLLMGCFAGGSRASGSGRDGTGCMCLTALTQTKQGRKPLMPTVSRFILQRCPDAQLCAAEITHGAAAPWQQFR